MSKTLEMLIEERNRRHWETWLRQYLRDHPLPSGSPPTVKATRDHSVRAET